MWCFFGQLTSFLAKSSQLYEDKFSSFFIPSHYPRFTSRVERKIVSLISFTMYVVNTVSYFSFAPTSSLEKKSTLTVAYTPVFRGRKRNISMSNIQFFRAFYAYMFKIHFLMQQNVLYMSIHYSYTKISKYSIFFVFWMCFSIQ